MSEQYLSMKKWAEDERPREKLLEKGAAALSTNELLAVILRSGRRGESALDLSRRILTDCKNDLNALAKLGVNDLVERYKGVGLAKAACVVAAIEVGRRKACTVRNQLHNASSSADVYKYISPVLKDLDHEEFWVIYLNRSNHVMGRERLFSGGMSSTVIDVRMLFKKTLDVKASAIIVVHNHPSETLLPSECDKAVTDKIWEAGKMLDISLHDHLIIGGDSYYSFVDEGIMRK